MSEAVTRICVTPTRNEGWIADNFARAASLWADHIIVADQNSTDSTVEKLQRIPKVRVFPNSSESYDESARQRLLLSKAREIPGRRIIIALDADEALSANVHKSSDWDHIKQAAPGTVLRFRWVNVLPGFEKVWISPDPIPCGYVDDGGAHQGSKIHSRRIPWPEGAAVLDLGNIVVLHFQYVAWDRVVSKHRWYQAWEHVQYPKKGALDIFRAYHHMYGSWSRSEISTLEPAWLKMYDDEGIGFRSLSSETVTWWDREVVALLCERGADHFRKIDIWDRDWNEVAAITGIGDLSITDPRSIAEKVFHRLLKATQGHRGSFPVRCFEKFLRLRGW